MSSEEQSMVSSGGAVDVVEPYWRLDEPNYYRNVGTDNSEYIKLYQQGGFQPSSSPAQQEWTFRMSDLNSYYLMSQSFFQFDFTLSDKATTRDQNTRNLIFPSDMRCLFKNVQLDLNSVAIESNNQNYWMYANIDRAFMSRQYIETAGSLGGMFLTDTRYDNPAYLGPYANMDYALDNDRVGVPADVVTLNEKVKYDGDYARLQTYAKKRALLSIKDTGSTAVPPFDKSSRCTLRVDMPSIFQFYRYWTRCHKGIDVQCRFSTVGDAGFITDRTRNGKRTPTTTDENYQMDWAGSGIVWWVKSMKPSPRVEANLNAMLQRGQEIFTPFETAKVYNFQPENGSQSYRIVNESSRPTRMIVAFQRKTALTSTDDNSVLQMPEGMSTMTAFVNGKKVPNIDIQMTCPKALPPNGYVVDGGDSKVDQQSPFDLTEPYMRYLLLTGTYNSAFKNNYSRGSGALGYVDWVSTSPFVCFDLSHNAIGDISGSNSEIVLQYNVNNPTINADYNLYACVYTERTVSFSLSEATSYVAIR